VILILHETHAASLILCIICDCFFCRFFHFQCSENYNIIP